MNFKEKANEWLNQKNIFEDIKDSIKNYSQEELEDAFYKDLEFGTGGMRGIVGAGTNRMNLYTIRRANYGFAKYLIEKFSNINDKKIVIAYDSRHFSKEFAIESAKVMATFGIKSMIFSELKPTPLLSYAVRQTNSIGGIVITASHNPPKYNGYKIYDENGCQLVPHLADLVIKNISSMRNLFEIDVLDENKLFKSNMAEFLNDDVEKTYIADLIKIQHNNLNKENIKIAFTPLHGTATKILPKTLKKAGYNVQVVEEQSIPDPNFETVKSPNPEEHSAFEYVVKLGKSINADILMATDPDADRIGLAVLNKDNAYEFLNGNQTGALLINYILNRKLSDGTLPKNGVVFDTVVTAKLGAEIAKKYGLEVCSTLTGFKFIGEQIAKLDKSNKEFVFGYEESFGYLISDIARDKDAIQAALICSEMTSYYKEKGKTLIDVLEDVYKEYGFYLNDLQSITFEGKEGKNKIDDILKNLRDNPPKNICSLNVETFEDYLNSVSCENGKESEINLPKSNVLKFILADGSWIAIRPSGTEPKIKFYYSVKDISQEDANNKMKCLKNYVNDVLKTI